MMRPPFAPGDRKVPWLDQCPAEWQFKPLKYLCGINRRTLAEATETETEFRYIDISSVDSEGRWNASEPMKFSDAPSRARRVLIDGDVLVSTVRTYLRAITYVEKVRERLVCSTGFAVLSANALVDPRFLAYWVRSSYFVDEVVARSVGVSYPAVNTSDIGNLPFPVIERDQQHDIAAFLDQETARIDALIEKKQRQIELLKEKRAALISHLVTKGINPGIAMKDTGILWLGQIPAHWRVYRAKVLFREINQRSATGDEELLTISHKTGVTRRSDKHVTMFMAESLEGYKKCHLGDLIINTMWAWMGAMGISAEAGIVSPSYNVYRLRRDDCDPWFYDYLFRTSQFIAEVFCHSKGVWTSRLRLYPEGFFEVQLPCPPLREQKEIVGTIRRETGHYDVLERRIDHSIKVLREYRTALISAAVTGKMDVRRKVHRANVKPKAPLAFRRAVLAAEIAQRLHGHPTFGRVKFQKVLYLCEHYLGMDLEGNFHRDAAGPYDNVMLRSVESQMQRQAWFAVRQEGQRFMYVPMAKTGEHRKYFDTYWSRHGDGLDSLINLLRPLDTERCEIVATLFAAWNDLIIANQPFGEDAIVGEVRTNWHASKVRFDENRLRNALQWMRGKGLIPKGRGKSTARAPEDNSSRET